MKIPYLRAWTRIFKYKERDTRLVFLVDLLIHIALFTILVIISSLVLSRIGAKEQVAWIVFYILCAIFLVPLASMMGRRFYDAGDWPYEGIIMAILFPLFIAVSTLLLIYPGKEKRTNLSIAICMITFFVIIVPSLLILYVLGLSIEELFHCLFT